MKRRPPEEETIYLDLKTLLKEICKAGYDMEAKDRIIWLDDAKKLVRGCLRTFYRAHETVYPQKRAEYYFDLTVEIGVMITELRCMDEEHVWRGPKDKDGNQKVVKRILEAIKNIDEGMAKWQASATKGRVPPDFEDGV